MQSSLRGIANKARSDKKYRFKNLFTLLNTANLSYQFGNLNRKSASGLDKMTWSDYKENFHDRVVELVERVKKKKYKAKLVRRTYISKANGKKRPLGIPVIEDKLLQQQVTDILSVIYEEDFVDNSFGYRRNRSCHNAIDYIKKSFLTNRTNYVVEADIKGFFDNIDHDWLIRMLEERINDQALLRLIKKWLKAGILEDEEVVQPKKGTPQGGTISPVLANIYLHYALDIWVEKVVKPRCEGDVFFCRYADDFICAFQYKRDAEKFYKVLPKRLNKFQLNIAEEKTNIISFSRFRKEENNSFSFLGFEFKWVVSRKGNDVVMCYTAKDKLRKSIENFKVWIKKIRRSKIETIFKMLNSKLRGYYNYYGVIGNYQRLATFYRHCIKLLYKWLNRRSQRKSFNWKIFKKKLNKYGVLKPYIAQKVGYQLHFA